MSEPSPKQTLSFLERRFRESGIRPRGSLGQNFLIDMNLQQLLLDAAELTANDVVLEVGTGTGGLTALAAPLVAALVTVEVDRNLFQLASEQLSGLPNLTMFCCDVLRHKHEIAPAVLEAVHTRLEADPSRRFKLLANLPYNVATPLLANLLTLARPPELMVCTVQKELAERIVARPGSKDYGSLAVWIQSQCRAEIVRTLGPAVFWPRPKVSSAFVSIRVDPERRGRIADLAAWHAFVRAVFSHRRKALRGELVSSFPQLTKPGVDELLAALSLDPKARAEQLDIDQLLRLSGAVGAALGRGL
jgi:16S rRNA (adenine1518-N6/adenine1519-N6)-dimethyltransferase